MQEVPPNSLLNTRIDVRRLALTKGYLPAHGTLIPDLGGVRSITLSSLIGRRVPSAADCLPLGRYTLERR